MECNSLNHVFINFQILRNKNFVVNNYSNWLYLFMTSIIIFFFHISINKYNLKIMRLLYSKVKSKQLKLFHGINKRNKGRLSIRKYNILRNKYFLIQLKKVLSIIKYSKLYINKLLFLKCSESKHYYNSNILFKCKKDLNRHIINIVELSKLNSYIMDFNTYKRVKYIYMMLNLCLFIKAKRTNHHLILFDNNKILFGRSVGQVSVKKKNKKNKLNKQYIYFLGKQYANYFYRNINNFSYLYFDISLVGYNKYLRAFYSVFRKSVKRMSNTFKYLNRVNKRSISFDVNIGREYNKYKKKISTGDLYSALKIRQQIIPELYKKWNYYKRAMILHWCKRFVLPKVRSIRDYTFVAHGGCKLVSRKVVYL